MSCCQCSEIATIGEVGQEKRDYCWYHYYDYMASLPCLPKWKRHYEFMKDYWRIEREVKDGKAKIQDAVKKPV